MKPMLSVEGVTVVFGKGGPGELAALKGACISLAEGESVAVIGSNGAGKSTLQNAICGKAEVESGSITLNGADITRMKDYERALEIGRISQDPMKGTAPSMSIEENLSLAYTRKAKGGLFALNRARRALFRDALARLGMGLENRLQDKAGTLSGGQRQALSLVMAIIAGPKLLLLDEHTAALDPMTAGKVMELTNEAISSTGVACMMITHDISLALAFGTRTAMMDEGRFIFDFSGSERKSLSVEKLMKMYSQKAEKELSSDRMLLKNR